MTARGSCGADGAKVVDSLLRLARDRVLALRAETRRLQQGEFPYPSSRRALDSIERLLNDSLDEIDRLLPDTGAPRLRVVTAARTALELAVACLPVLGFVLRSTNVRNAFELYRPMASLARCLEHAGKPGADVELLLSSEWEYSPFISWEGDVLPEFILVGFPAQESGNPLVFPVGGHELGHRLWRNRKLDKDFAPRVASRVTAFIADHLEGFRESFPDLAEVTGDLAGNVLVSSTVALANGWSLRQAEETFCDHVGVLLFGASFLHAMAYLMAPGGAVRAPEYPDTLTRIDNVVAAAQAYGVETPSDFIKRFEPPTPQAATPGEAYLTRAADAALTGLVPELRDRAEALVREASVTLPSQVRRAGILQGFKRMVPAPSEPCLGDILCAGWDVYLDPAFWPTFRGGEDERQGVIKDLVLKSVELHGLIEVPGERP